MEQSVEPTSHVAFPSKTDLHATSHNGIKLALIGSGENDAVPEQVEIVSAHAYVMLLIGAKCKELDRNAALILLGHTWGKDQFFRQRVIFIGPKPWKHLSSSKMYT